MAGSGSSFDKREKPSPPGICTSRKIKIWLQIAGQRGGGSDRIGFANDFHVAVTFQQLRQMLSGRYFVIDDQGAQWLFAIHLAGMQIRTETLSSFLVISIRC